jgi:hypothetical protein
LSSGASFHELQAVAERVSRIEPPVAFKLMIGFHRSTSCFEPLLHFPQALHEQRRMGLVSGAEALSTPRWSSTEPERNQQPPSRANPGGFSISTIPITPA